MSMGDGGTQPEGVVGGEPIYSIKRPIGTWKARGPMQARRAIGGYKIPDPAPLTPDASLGTRERQCRGVGIRRS